jgi:hypothetical protein
LARSADKLQVLVRPRTFELLVYIFSQLSAI